MDFIYTVAGFRHPATDSVSGSVIGGSGGVFSDSVSDSVVPHVQNEEVHAQQPTDSAGKYTLSFPHRINGEFKGILHPV